MIIHVTETTGGTGVDLVTRPFQALLIGGTKKAVLIQYTNGQTQWIPRKRLAVMKHVEATLPWPTFTFQFKW